MAFSLDTNKKNYYQYYQNLRYSITKNYGMETKTLILIC